MRALGSVRVGRDVKRSRWITTAYAVTLVALLSCKGDGPTAVVINGLRFVAQPTTAIAGTPFTVSVELLGSNGQRATRADDQVTIAAAGVAISGPTTVPAVNGLATFADLTIATPSSSLQLTASSGEISVTSVAFSVQTGPPSLARSTVSPPPCQIYVGVPMRMKFAFKDVAGNPLVGAATTLSTTLEGASFSPNSGAATLEGEFETRFLATIPGPAPISAVVGGTPLNFVSPYDAVALTLPAPIPMAFPGNANGSIGAGCAATGFPTQSHRFVMPADGGAAFTLASAAEPDYGISTDPPGQAIAFPLFDPQVTREWLLPAGAYRFVVQSFDLAGTYTLSGVQAPANTGCVIRTIVVAGTINGQTFGTGDCALEEDNSFIDEFFFMDSRPCRITLRSPTTDTFLFAVHPSTFEGSGDNNSGGGVNGTDSQITLQSCTASGGPLLIVTNHFPPNPVSAAYTLTIEITGGAPPAGRPSDPTRARFSVPSHAEIQDGINSLSRLRTAR